MKDYGLWEDRVGGPGNRDAMAGVRVDDFYRIENEIQTEPAKTQPDRKPQKLPATKEEFTP